jgi:hypothetical protein
MTILYKSYGQLVLWANCEEIGGDYWQHAHIIDDSEWERLLNEAQGNKDVIRPQDIDSTGHTVPLLEVTEDLLSIMCESEGVELIHIWPDDQEEQDDML